MTEESRAIMLELLATDPELSSELARFRQGRERSDFAITVKKIGVLALRRLRVALRPNRFAVKATA